MQSKPTRELLSEAIKSDNLQNVRLLLNSQLQKQQYNGMLPINEAAYHQRWNIMLFLLEDLEKSTPKNTKITDSGFVCGLGRALHYYVDMPYYDPKQTVVERFLNLGASPEIYYDNTKKYTLHIAAERGLYEIAKLLLDAGANLNVKDNNNNLPLDLAFENKHSDCARLLSQRAGTEQDESKRKLLSEAIESDNLQNVRLLLNSQLQKQKYNNMIPITEAAYHQRWNIMLFLLEDLEKSTPKNTKITDSVFVYGLGWALLYYVGMPYHDPKQTVVERFLNLGASPELYYSNTKKYTLHIAAERGLYEIAKHLLDAGANLNVKENNNNNLPLDLAFRYKHSDCVRLLSQRAGTARKLLSEAIKSDNLQDVWLLLSSQLQKQKYNNMIPITEAAYHQRWNIMLFLLEDLEKSTPKNTKITDSVFVYGLGWALHYYVGMSYYNPQQTLVKRFLNLGASPEIYYGNTKKYTLHIAAERGLYEFVKLLLDAGACLNVKDQYNKVPLDFALQNDHKACADLLSLYNKNRKMASIIFWLISISDENATFYGFVRSDVGQLILNLVLKLDPDNYCFQALDILLNTVGTEKARALLTLNSAECAVREYNCYFSSLAFWKSNDSYTLFCSIREILKNDKGHDIFQMKTMIDAQVNAFIRNNYNSECDAIAILKKFHLCTATHSNQNTLIPNPSPASGRREQLLLALNLMAVPRCLSR